MEAPSIPSPGLLVSVFALSLSFAFGDGILAEGPASSKAGWLPRPSGPTFWLYILNNVAAYQFFIASLESWVMTAMNELVVVKVSLAQAWLPCGSKTLVAILTMRPTLTDFLGEKGLLGCRNFSTQVESSKANRWVGHCS